MHPVLFKIFGHEIITYGFSLGISFLIIIIFSSLRSRKEGIEPSLVVDCFLWVFIGSLLLSKLIFMIQHPNLFILDQFFVIKIWKGGFSSLGGLLGGLLVLIVFLKLKKEKILKFLDLITPYLGLGFAIQKFLGCFMAGCCYGKQTNLPWGITFNDPHASIPYGLIGKLLHPTQIYEGLLGISILIILIYTRDHNFSSTIINSFKQKYGLRTLFFLILFSGGRFITGYFRGDEIKKYFNILSFNQLTFGLIFILTSIVFVVIYYHLKKRVN